jgi:hypothetical protein
MFRYLFVVYWRGLPYSSRQQCCRPHSSHSCALAISSTSISSSIDVIIICMHADRDKQNMSYVCAMQALAKCLVHPVPCTPQHEQQQVCRCYCLVSLSCWAAHTEEGVINGLPLREVIQQQLLVKQQEQE